MARLLIWLLIVVLLVGGLVWLGTRDGSQPVSRIEKVITLDAPAR